MFYEAEWITLGPTLTFVHLVAHLYAISKTFIYIYIVLQVINFLVKGAEVDVNNVNTTVLHL